MVQPEPNADDIAAAELLWDYHCIYETPRPADAIVGFGSYDLRVADWCAELFTAGFASVVMFSGGAGNWTKDLYGTSEAKAFSDRAEERGVPRNAMLLEERASNIGENIRLTKALCPGMKTVILVTKPQTQRRVRATVDRQWRKIDAIVTAPIHPFSEQPAPHHGLYDLICEMVGDLWRMKAYPTLGFQIEQDVPEKVAAAYDRLVSRGFTGHLPEDTAV
jgi:hypothetical protein